MLTVRVDREWLEWLKSYAQNHSTTMSKLIRDFLVQLRAEEEKEQR